MSWFVKTFKDKCQYKNKNNKLMSPRIDKPLPIDDYKLLEKNKTFCTKIEDSRKLN